MFYGGALTAFFESLRPEEAQQARFFPAYGRLDALFDYYSAGWRPGLRRIRPEGLSILTQHGIPTRMD
jgi:hypothetical protein